MGYYFTLDTSISIYSSMKCELIHIFDDRIKENNFIINEIGCDFIDFITKKLVFIMFGEFATINYIR